MNSSVWTMRGASAVGAGSATGSGARLEGVEAQAARKTREAAETATFFISGFSDRLIVGVSIGGAYNKPMQL